MNNSKNTTPDEIVLGVKGLGHIPAFKNKKRIMRGRLITDPRAQKWMKECVSSFTSQLRRMFQTGDDATSTGCWQRSAIASLPSDDNWQQMSRLTISVKEVPKGEEGGTVTLTKISPV